MKYIATTLLLLASVFAQAPEQITATTTLNDSLKNDGFVVSFNAPPIKDAAVYLWIWGDGLFKELPANGGATVSHAFKHAGNFTVHLVVTDATKHNLFQSEVRVRINQPVEINP